MKCMAEDFLSPDILCKVCHAGNLQAPKKSTDTQEGGNMHECTDIQLLVFCQTARDHGLKPSLAAAAPQETPLKLRGTQRKPREVSTASRSPVHGNRGYHMLKLSSHGGLRKSFHLMNIYPTDRGSKQAKTFQPALPNVTLRNLFWWNELMSRLKSWYYNTCVTWAVVQNNLTSSKEDVNLLACAASWLRWWRWCITVLSWIPTNYNVKRQQTRQSLTVLTAQLQRKHPLLVQTHTSLLWGPVLRCPSAEKPPEPPVNVSQLAFLLFTTHTHTCIA